MPLLSRKDNKNSTKHRFGMNHLRRLFSTRYQPVMQEQQPLMASEETTNFHRYNTLASLEGRAASNRSSEWFDWIDQIHEEKKEEEQQPQGSGILRACLSPLQLDKPLPLTPPAPPVPPKDNSKSNSNGRPLPPTPSPPPVPPKDPRRRYTKPLPPLPLSYTKRPLPPTPPKPQVPPKDF
ncbi:hypothetical protein BFW01_g4737 [Lasiodiplodia theobromae]|nr:hypothetical protein BFW01_g4737 [Lasiodiplodia theobromae]